MSEYMTKKEAIELLGKSTTYLDNRIASGEISTAQDPNDGRKKLVLASDVYRIKAENDLERERKERERQEKTVQDPQLPQLPEDIEVKELKLNILDAVDAYNVSVSALSLYDEEIKALAEIPTEERKEPFMELVHRIIEKHKGSGGN